MKSFLNFSLRLFALKILVEVIYALMLLFILVNIRNEAVSILVAIMGIGVFMMLLWDYASRQGTKDSVTLDAIGKTRAMGGRITQHDLAAAYKPWKGFAAAGVACIPGIIMAAATVICLAGGNRWGHALHSLMTVLNTTFVPIFQCIKTANPFLDMSVIPGAMSVGSMLHVKNTVAPYLYFVPQLIYILWGGICYVIGHYYRQQLKPINKGIRR